MNLFLKMTVFYKFFPSHFSSTAMGATQNVAKHEPIFVTRSETFKFVAGETIHLPCEVSNAGKFEKKKI